MSERSDWEVEKRVKTFLLILLWGHRNSTTCCYIVFRAVTCGQGMKSFSYIVYHVLGKHFLCTISFFIPERKLSYREFASCFFIFRTWGLERLSSVSHDTRWVSNRSATQTCALKPYMAVHHISFYSPVKMFPF